ncbi:cathepsin L-like protein [Aphelenchoides avenae]|nr:cathepsin L-like protein [Aphelenchus avenae]
MVRTILLPTLSCVLLGSFAPTTEALGPADFVTFLKKFGLSYPKEEVARRQGIFLQNAKKIEELKAKGLAWVGVNKFSALTTEEFKKMLMPLSAPSPLGQIAEVAPKRTKRATPPASYDMRTYSWVSSVKNQGQCGACWAFATAALVESAYLRKYNANYDLAEQQLVDCVAGTYGCSGGWVNNSMGYVMSKGITYESYYPYLAYKSTCRQPSSGFAAVTWFKINYESDIPYYLYNYGAVAFMFSVPSSFQHYAGGVFDVSDCSTNLVGKHEITIIGYSSSYWIAKNSWGTTWGPYGGFVYYARGKNLCNMAEQLICVYCT